MRRGKQYFGCIFHEKGLLMNSSEKLLIIKTEKRLNGIRRAYRRGCDRTEPFALWLNDNYYLIEREGRCVIKAMSEKNDVRRDTDGLPYCYNVCLSILEQAVLPGEKTLVMLLSKYALTNGELTLLGVFIRAALIKRVYDACLGNTSDESIIRNAVLSFGRCADIDFSEVTLQLSDIERILSEEKCGIYPSMCERTRAIYRAATARSAKKRGVSEADEAQRIRELADAEMRHVGEFIDFPKPKKRRGAFFIWLEIVLTLALSGAAAYFTGDLLLFFLLPFPLAAILRPVSDRLMMLRLPASFIMRMDTGGIVPAGAKTLITVSSLLPSPEKCAGLKKHLEELRRTNGGQNVHICLLADMRASDVPEKPEDEADTDAAMRVITALNKKYGGGFILAVRKRKYSDSERVYTGFERKRGALTALCAYITGKSSGGEFLIFDGDTAGIKNTKYLLALDSDTVLPMDALQTLVGTALHPLNRAVIKDGRVVSGSGIFAPRVGTGASCASSTRFTRLFAGDGGVSVYDVFVSEKYQDVFGSGTFCGKGLIDVNAMASLDPALFPRERILSHDIPEGELLHTAFVSDVEFTDSFPHSPAAYFSRQQRWIRGDLQNTVYLGKTVGSGKNVTENPLTSLSKYKLLDNIRAALTPAATLLTLLFSIILPQREAYITAGIALFSVCAPHLFSALSALKSGGAYMLSRRFYSGAKPIARREITLALYMLAVLPENAWCSFSASAKALWRMYVSKRKLLEWTVASDTGDKPSLREFLPSVIFGAVLIISYNPLLIAAGAYFLLTSFLPIPLSKGKKPREERVTAGERELLGSYAAAMWKYYDELCTKKEHYLPPDNLQETPVFRVAHRTSPTNIGLMMVSCLAARDFGFIDSEELCIRLGNVLDTVDKLEKYEGNLLNWYETETLTPLRPRYVSSVDSGNFLCCLTALKQGLLEYVGECGELRDTVLRITRLMCDTDISVFYNSHRSLFSIGIDAESGELTESYYDLLMSEARMTGYYAVSSRQVPKKHWGALGRTLVRDGRYTGLVSWTGTAFEYFMPALFMPVYENTEMYEALRFCLHCQKKRVKGSGIPFGMSESGFYAFDGMLNYQYKAHGVGKLALKKNMNSDTVIAPYSSFLMLSFAKNAALKNLKELEKYRITGRYGFFEAVDFTRRRLDGQDYAVVHSYMAHHIGMSLLGLDNALRDGIMQKRFMRDEQMAAGRFMLEEKIRTGAPVYSDLQQREIPQRSERVTNDTYVSGEVSPLSPEVRVYTNGEWSCVISDCGAGVSLYRGLDVTKREGDLLRRPAGVFAVLVGENRVYPFTRSQDYTRAAEFSAEFSRTGAVLRAVSDGAELSEDIRVHTRVSGETRRFTVKNTGKEAISGKLRIYFEPSLAHCRDSRAHPAFSKLFCEKIDSGDGNIVLFRGRSRSTGECAYLAAGFFGSMGGRELRFERESVLRSPFGISSLADKTLPKAVSGGTDKCFFAEIPIKLQPKQSFSETLFLVGAPSRAEAERAALEMRSERDKTRSGAPSPFSESSLDGVIASTVLPYIFYSGENSRIRLDAVMKNTLGQKDLWSMGVSGDVPLITVELACAADAVRIRPYVQLMQRLKKCGEQIQLAIIYSEKGEYGSPFLAAIRGELASTGEEENGGSVVLVNALTAGEERLTLLKSVSCYCVPAAGEKLRAPHRRYNPKRIIPAVPRGEKASGFCDGGFESNGRSSVPWCTVLCNRSFGTLLSDRSLGFTYALNSRENKLTPWFNDTRTDNNGEMLLMKYNGKIFDLVCGSDAFFAEDFVRYKAAYGDLRTSVSVRVPPAGMTKTVTLELFNVSERPARAEVLYYTEPVLSSGDYSGKTVKSFFAQGALWLAHSFESSFAGIASLSVREGTELYTTSKSNVFCGNWKKCVSPGDYLCAAVGKPLEIKPYERVRLTFVLSYGFTADSVVKLNSFTENAENNMPERRYKTLVIDTPDDALNALVNTFLEKQIIDSRLLSRTGFYQCGGAYGYRDQLQDVLALVLTRPRLCVRQIIRCAAAQFREGDVLHWWHAFGGRELYGVRTRCSDDLLWLPYAVAEYVSKTDDISILYVNVPYVTGAVLSDDERERCAYYSFSGERESVYAHCKRALQHAFSRGYKRDGTGRHGIMLIGGCDWNDGFSSIGTGGEGESVWLSQFASLTARLFSAVSERFGDSEFSRFLSRRSEELLSAVEKEAWDGDRYLRAFMPEGEPLGGDGCRACAVDSLPQSFAVLSGMADREHRLTALDTAYKRLVDKDAGIIKLFDPPFATYAPDIGYTSAYPAGVRENGGQYTHAAVWLASAFFKEHMPDRGLELLKILNPAEKFFSGDSERYAAEPYMLAGDVNSAGAPGRAGWSLYTGAAGWYFRTVYEELLGVKQRAGRIFFEPCLPDDRSTCSFELILPGGVIRVRYERTGEHSVTIDGETRDYLEPDGKSHDIICKF